jgi:hypothetical protein
VARLAEVLRITPPAPAPTPAWIERIDPPIDVDGLALERWLLHDGDDWTLPCVVVSPPAVNSTVLLVADAGYGTQAQRVAELAAAGTRVICLDLLFCGGAAMEEGRTGTLHLNVQFLPTLGARPLGVQARQIVRALDAFAVEYKFESATLASVGARTGVAGLCAAALDGGTRIRNRTHAPLPKDQQPSWSVLADVPASLKELLSYGYYDAPELYCFGLLEWFDVPQLEELAARNIPQGERSR